MTEQPQTETQTETQQPYQQPAPPAYKRLLRSTWDAPISGVCGGLAAYLGLDPTLVRVLMVIAAVVTFPVGVILYALMWALIPKA